MSIIQFPPPGARRPVRPSAAPLFQSIEHEAFCRARQELTKRLVAWAATNPNPADLDAELSVLPGLFDQLRQVTVPA